MGLLEVTSLNKNIGFLKRKIILRVMDTFKLYLGEMRFFFDLMLS